LSNVGSLYQSLREGEAKGAGLNRNRGFQSGYVIAEEDDHVGLGAVSESERCKRSSIVPRLTSRHGSFCAARLQRADAVTVRS
jgi:hypothetical protein